MLFSETTRSLSSRESFLAAFLGTASSRITHSNAVDSSYDSIWPPGLHKLQPIIARRQVARWIRGRRVMRRCARWPGNVRSLPPVIQRHATLELPAGDAFSRAPFHRVNTAHWWGVGPKSLSSGVRWSTVLSARVPDRTAIGAQEGVKADYAGVLEGSIPPASNANSFSIGHLRPRKRCTHTVLTKPLTKKRHSRSKRRSSIPLSNLAYSSWNAYRSRPR
jgi:hypothetical protein